jgi:hypothetical protein
MMLLGFCRGALEQLVDEYREQDGGNADADGKGIKRFQSRKHAADHRKARPVDVVCKSSFSAIQLQSLHRNCCHASKQRAKATRPGNARAAGEERRRGIGDI